MDYTLIVVGAVCAIVFYRAGLQENKPAVALAWTALSVLVSLLSVTLTSWRVWGVVAGQILLFISITLFRLWREGDAPSE